MSFRYRLTIVVVQSLLGVTPPSNFEIKEDREPGGGRRRRQ
jgi:hypothetical protein